MQKKEIAVFIDQITRERATGDLLIVGWAIDEVTKEIPTIKVEKENVIKEEVTDDSDELSASEDSDKLGFSFGNGTTFDFKNILPNYGLGVRVALGDGTSVRVDYGFGRHSNELIININEAF